MAPPPPPPPKLRQSPIHSFLFPNQNPPTPTPTPTPKPSITTAAAAASASDYERLRRETIRRNREFLQKLGITAVAAAAAASPNPLPSKRPKKAPPLPPPPPPNPSVPLRRSARKRPPPPPSPSDSEDKPSSPQPSFVDSSVYQYACCSDAPLLGTHPSSPYQNPNSPITGFRIVGKPFRDPSLTKIYTLDVFSFKEDRFLLAAGGNGGFISVYGGGREGDRIVEGDSDDESESETELPLMSWKGSGSWISGVRFIDENPMLLLSSSNDGGIVVWDIKRQPASPSSSSRSPPIVVRSAPELHSGGIFAMDRFGCSIATASKDSSVGFSRLTPAGDLVAERNVSGHHSGVVRGICFREGNTVADCGADGRICVLDMRLPHPCTLTIETEHTTGVNTVEWCTLDGSLLLSASKDPVLHLHDVRNPARALRALQGHVESCTGTCHQIYRPCFVDGGKAVATPGRGSRKISLFDVSKGTMISRGIIGYDANLVFSTNHAEQQRLWAAGRYVDQLRPLLHPPTRC